MLAERAKDISSLLQSDLHTYINVLHLFAQHTGLAEVIIKYIIFLFVPTMYNSAVVPLKGRTQPFYSRQFSFKGIQNQCPCHVQEGKFLEVNHQLHKY